MSADPGKAPTDASPRPESDTYRRSTGSPRGQARRAELLAKVTEDIMVNGLTDFSLRRAARAAGTTHKVLLYHFEDVDELLASAVAQLRDRRIGRSLDIALDTSSPTLASRVRAIWTVLTGAEETALLQAMGLAIYDPARYTRLVDGSADEYLTTLRAVCPADWADVRKDEVAQMILATLRGLLLAHRTGAGDEEIDAGLNTLIRALEREEDAAAPP